VPSREDPRRVPLWHKSDNGLLDNALRARGLAEAISERPKSAVWSERTERTPGQVVP
jgi:hypothetical protein